MATLTEESTVSSLCGLGLKPDCLFNSIQSRYKVGVGMGSGVFAVYV